MVDDGRTAVVIVVVVAVVVVVVVVMAVTAQGDSEPMHTDDVPTRSHESNAFRHIVKHYGCHQVALLPRCYRRLERAGTASQSSEEGGPRVTDRMLCRHDSRLAVAVVGLGPVASGNRSLTMIGGVATVTAGAQHKERSVRAFTPVRQPLSARARARILLFFYAGEQRFCFI